MSAVWLRARAEIRDRRQALISATLICGLVGAAVLATLAGARRTQSVYPRFLETHRAEDVIISDISVFEPVFWAPDFEKLSKLEYVEAGVRFTLGGVGGELGADLKEGTIFIASPDPNFMRTIRRPLVVEGRLPDPTKPDEIAVPYFADGELGTFEVGSRKRLQISDEEIVEFTVVGHTVFPGELPPAPIFGYGILMTPAFLDRYGEQIGFRLDSIMLRFRDRDDIIRFQDDLRELSGGKIVQPQQQDSHARAVLSSTNLQASALRLLALFMALTGALIVGQLLARETAIGADDAGILRALGFDRRQRFVLGILRAAPVAIGGALLAIVAAWLASPLFPRGSVRTITPSIAPTFDAAVLGTGSLVIVAAVLVLIVPAAWRAAGVAGRTQPVQERPSRIAAFVSTIGMSTPAITGARLALERGRGRTAVPVVSSMIVVSLGIAAFVAASTFAGSLDLLIDRPDLYGKTWDSEVSTWIDEELPPDDKVPRTTAAALANDPDIEALALADSGIPFRVFSERGPERGIPVQGLAVMNLKGSVLPPILEGRAPESPNEVVLGTRMLRELRLRLDPLRPPNLELSLQGNEKERVSMRVVGRAVIPPLGNFGELGYGVALTSEEAILELLSGSDRPPVVVDVLIRWRPGVDPQEVLARYRDRFPRLGEGEEITSGNFADVVNFGGVQGAPLIVGGVLAALGAAALAHVLVTAIRQRRRDVAILKTMGFVRGQARRAVAWQSTFTVLVAMAIGVPLGIGGGRFLWGRVADNIGVRSRPHVSLILIGILVPAVIVIANLIAALPARSAARTRPALVLRSE
jgi:ABC-type lipoprotein release transport system permease subunit